MKDIYRAHTPLLLVFDYILFSSETVKTAMPIATFCLI